jgi:hypothetical protein
MRRLESTDEVLQKLETRRRTHPNLVVHNKKNKLKGMTAAQIYASGRIPLTEKQSKFVHAIAEGLPPAAAARAAGYSDQSIGAGALSRSPIIQAGIMAARARFEAAASMTRKKVIDGLTEAIQMAKVQGDPTAMIMGWRELGRMCGYYEAVKHQVAISVTGQVTHQAIRALSDEDLLRLADEGEATGRLLEGECAAP